MSASTAIAGTCPVCAGSFAWSQIPPGAHGITCPRCLVPVELNRATAPLGALPGPPLALMPTFPKPAALPNGMEVKRGEASTLPPAPAIDGPFRTPGQTFIQRRDKGVLTIELPQRRTGARINAGAVVWGGAWLLISAVTPASLLLALAVGAPPVGLSLALRARPRRLVLDAHALRANGLTIDRATITHLFSIGVRQGTTSFVLWQLRVRSDARDYVVATTDSLDDLNALASLLATELALPTWVPATPTGR